jgi:hypothetical protein
MGLHRLALTPNLLELRSITANPFLTKRSSTHRRMRGSLATQSLDRAQLDRPNHIQHKRWRRAQPRQKEERGAMMQTADACSRGMGFQIEHLIHTSALERNLTQLMAYLARIFN